MTIYAKPLPRPADLDNAPHWAGARKGRLMLQRCDHCARFRFPAAPVCPRCRRAGAHWEAAGGEGVVESFCRFHKAYWPGFADELPYTVVQVLLDEGVRLYSNLLGRSPCIGMRVCAFFEAVTRDVTLVKFKPCAECEGTRC
jgi:uncharacterized OB-fold protein